MTSITKTIINHLSSISSREMAEQQKIYNKHPKTNNTIKEAMKFDLSPLYDRPMPWKNFSWTTNDIRFKVIEHSNLMRDFFTHTPSLKENLKGFSMGRFHANVYLTLTGTINHQGMLLVGILPNNLSFTSTDASTIINTLLTGPHCMVGANEATSACLEVPFFINTDFISLGAFSGSDPTVPDISQGTNFARLVAIVMNPLAVTGASSTTLTAHLEVQLKDLEVYVPTPSNPTFVSPPTFLAESFVGPVVTSTLDAGAKLMKKTSSDFIDALRATVRSYTGLHNPNIPDPADSMVLLNKNRTNLVDTQTYFEKMDPYSKFTRLTKDSIFHTHEDEMDLKFILSKPQYLGTLQVLTTDVANKLLWSRPISPWQGGCFGGTAVTSNIERLYYNTLAWSGDMELIVQSSMTNKQNVKLIVGKLYSLDRRILTQVPDTNSIRTGISNLLEFSGGNQQLTVDLDFLSRNQILYNTIDSSANALQHGMYYIYLQQPLVSGEGAPTSVEFNLYLRCKPNFKLYGYGFRPSYTSNHLSKGPFYSNPIPPLNTIVEEKEEQLNFEAESFSESGPVMNIPSQGKPLADVDSSTTSEDLEVERMHHVKHLRDLVRRPQYTNVYSVNADSNGIYTLVIPVVDLINMFPTGAETQSSASSLIKMFVGCNGGLKIKIRSRGHCNYVVQYYPPTLMSGNSAEIPSQNYLTGSVVSALNSSFLDLRKPLHSGNICEFPTSWGLDMSGGNTFSVTDIHIPHSTIYHWWGNCDWSRLTNPSYDNHQTIANNMGSLVISGKAGLNQTEVTFSIIACLDDEARLGYHCVAPIMWIPLTNDGLYYDVPEKVPTTTAANFSRVAPVASYYTSLITAYDTSPIV